MRGVESCSFIEQGDQKGQSGPLKTCPIKQCPTLAPVLCLSGAFSASSVWVTHESLEEQLEFELLSHKRRVLTPRCSGGRISSLTDWLRALRAFGVYFPAFGRLGRRWQRQRPRLARAIKAGATPPLGGMGANWVNFTNRAY